MKPAKSLLFSGMTDFHIREGIKTDVPAVLELVRELALYERAPLEVTNTEESMIEDGFGPNPAFGLLVAESNEVIVGIAIHFIRYSTWKGKMLYLEDIVVRESFRGNGIGNQLFERCCALVLENNYASMAWQVLAWNEPALNFYRKYNAILDNEWVNGKLTKEQIGNMFQ